MTKHDAWHELQNITQWFKDTDWMVNKIITGEWATDDIRWTTYLQERAVNRARQDYLLTIEE